MKSAFRWRVRERWWRGWSHWAVSDSFDPLDCSPPGSSVHGTFQARTLEWVAVSFSGSRGKPFCSKYYKTLFDLYGNLILLILIICNEDKGKPNIEHWLPPLNGTLYLFNPEWLLQAIFWVCHESFLWKFYYHFTEPCFTVVLLFLSLIAVVKNHQWSFQFNKENKKMKFLRNVLWQGQFWL